MNAAINPAEKTVTVHALDSGKVYTETYDKLLLAPGAKPTVPALSGVSSERVFTLRTVEDTLRIRRFVEDQKPKTAVLAGGGFIGLEMAENLAEMGVSVTIVQLLKQLLAPLDADMASFVHAEMRRHGVVLRLGETVTGFRQDGDSVLTLLEGSEPLHSDMVLLAIGVTPDTHLAKEAGLRLGIRGSIAVNERMETSVPDIYAVGDAVEVTHFVTGQKVLISLAGPASPESFSSCSATAAASASEAMIASFTPRSCETGTLSSTCGYCGQTEASSEAFLPLRESTSRNCSAVSWPSPVVEKSVKIV